MELTGATTISERSRSSEQPAGEIDSMKARLKDMSQSWITSIVLALNLVRFAGTALLCLIVKMAKRLTAILYEFNSTRINYCLYHLSHPRGENSKFRDTLQKRISDAELLKLKNSSLNDFDNE